MRFIKRGKDSCTFIYKNLAGNVCHNNQQYIAAAAGESFSFLILLLYGK